MQKMFSVLGMNNKRANIFCLSEIQCSKSKLFSFLGQNTNFGQITHLDRHGILPVINKN